MNPRLLRSILLAAIAVIGLVFWLNLTSDKTVEEATTVLERQYRLSITSNLRQVASSGQQYIIATGADSVGYRELLDAGYMPALNSVRGERYDNLVVVSIGGVLRVSVPEYGELGYTY